VKDRLFSFFARHRLATLLVTYGITLAVGSGAWKIRSDIILWHLFPYSHPYFQLHARFSRVFGGGGSTAVIAVKDLQGDIFNEQSLQKVKKITDEVLSWDEICRLLTTSMATHSTKVVKTKARGEISMDPLMYPDIPRSEPEIELLKQHLFSNPAYDGSLVSSDGTAALIITEFKDDISYERAFELLRSLVTRYSDDRTSVHIVGFPMLLGWICSYKHQMFFVFVLSILLMIVILYVVFRNMVGMIAPVAMSGICAALGLGFIGWTGINFSPLLYVLAFLVGARMLSNAVQITNRYIEELRLSGDPQTACYETMRAMTMPNAAAVATDVAGFMVLTLAKIVLMLHTAIMMSFWMLTIGLSGILVPIICSYLPMKSIGKPETQRESDKLANFLAGLVRFTLHRASGVAWAVVAIIVVLGTWQTSRLKVGDPTPGSPLLWPDHTYNQDEAFINRAFKASSESLTLYYDGEPGSVYDPEVLVTFEQFDRHMAETLPDIYKSSMSIINLVRMMNLTYHDGDQFWFQLPRDRILLEGILGMVRQQAGSAALGRYLDPGLERTQITLFFADHTSGNMLRIKEAAYGFFDEHPMEISRGRFHLAGGSIGLEIALNEEMKAMHFQMDVAVLGAIFLMCWLAFRSLVAGIMLTLPLILSNLVAYTYMSFADIGLTTSTLPCAAVGVGVGVDFAIYLYSRCIEEFRQQDDWETTILRSVRTGGKGILFSGITLILPLAAWYLIAPLKFQAQMGFFLAMLLFVNMAAAFTLHPMMIMLIKPSFMKRSRDAAQRIGTEEQDVRSLFSKHHGSTN
jgi:predicted RND superfamily exporter protein